MKFQTQLAPHDFAWHRGFAAQGDIDPSAWADELFGADVPGPWLTCYMIRRFGWPNLHSDSYKQFCSWALTTPIDGLWVAVTPYLGHDGLTDAHAHNLHFGVRFSKTLCDEVEADQQAAWRERETPSALTLRIREAVEAVLRDLLRPTYVRDINFSIFGDTERNPQAREKCGATIADPFVGAGRTPEQWFASLATKH